MLVGHFVLSIKKKLDKYCKRNECVKSNFTIFTSSNNSQKVIFLAMSGFSAMYVVHWPCRLQRSFSQNNGRFISICNIKLPQTLNIYQYQKVIAAVYKNLIANYLKQYETEIYKANNK